MLKKLELKTASKRERRAAEQEAKLLSRLKHPNIVSYKDSFQDGKHQGSNLLCFSLKSGFLCEHIMDFTIYRLNNVEDRH